MAILDLVIVGGGATGLAAAVRAAAEGLSPAVLERGVPGGRLREVGRVQAVPGYPVGLSGTELVDRSLTQARRFGAEIRTGATVTALRRWGDSRILELADGTEVAARAVIVATGNDLPDLSVVGLGQLTGSGIYFGIPLEVPEAICGKDLFLVGELGLIGEAGLRLSPYCRSVMLLPPRRPRSPGADAELVRRLRAALNLSLRPGREIVEVGGVEHLETLTLLDTRTGRRSVRNAAALFLVGLETPRTGWLETTVQRDERGFVMTGSEVRPGATADLAWSLDRPPSPLESSVPGVFAAGGARRGAGWCPGCSIEEGIGAARQAAEYLRHFDNDPTGWVASPALPDDNR